MAAEFEIALQDAVPPLVLALDVGSTASRGMIYDAHGRPAGRRAKVAHGFTVAPDGTSVIDPDQVLEELSSIVDELTGTLEDVRPGEGIAGVALDTFASSLVVVDGDGRPLTPCFTYADGRCGRQVESLREELVEAEVQERTGARIHSSYWPARLRWLAEDQPEVVAGAAHYLSLGDYVLRALTGVLATGTSSAAWTGLVDRQTADWSAPDVAAAGIRLDQLPPIRHLDQPLDIAPDRAAELAERWPALRDARWFAAVADGFAANVGLGAGDETTIGASCATSGALRVVIRQMPDTLPPGLWCYRVSHDRALLGGALNDVGRALSWADATLRVEEGEDREASADAMGVAAEPAASEASRPATSDAAEPATNDAAEPATSETSGPAAGDTDDLSRALMAAPQDTTPLMLPFFTGERSTGWAADARAVFTGVGASSTPVELYRGVVEGIALSYARVVAVLREVAPEPDKLYCGGRVTADRPELLQVMADAMGTPVTPITIKRSTLHGTALLALETLAPGVERADADHGPTLEPAPARQGYYADRSARFERLYDALFG